MKLKLFVAAAVMLLLAAKTPAFGDRGPLAGLIAAVVMGALIWTSLPGGLTPARAGHAHGDRTTVARHEAGHAVVIKALGGRIDSAKIGDGWGYVAGDWPRDNPTKGVAFYAAGQLSAGTSKGCGYDNEQIRKELRRVPSNERDRVYRDGVALARKTVTSRSGEVKRLAKRLDEKGRL